MNWNLVASDLLATNAGTAIPPSVQLPVLPQALHEFRQAAQDPDVQLKKLARIISSDSGLSTELLRNVNSCENGLRREIVSVDQALVVLGVKKALLHLTMTGLRNAMKSTSSKLVNFQNFWNTNLERAIFAREIARYLKADENVAFTAGMLQDFLLPLITNQQFDEYVQFIDTREQDINIVSFEMQTFGWNHADAAAHIMHAWKFTPALVCCVAMHHKNIEILDDSRFCDTAVAATAIASLVPDALRQESNGMAKLLKLKSYWPDFDLEATAKNVSEQFETMTGKRNRYSLERALEIHLRSKNLNH